MHVSGKIDSHSFVYPVSTGGSILVDGKIDGGSMVFLVSWPARSLLAARSTEKR
jgi:hypothetical protein